jgi:GDP-D-mannose 3', 5'-epimerase
MKIKGQKIVVCGAGGFIGGHLVKSLQASGAGEIRAVDIKPLDEWYQKTASGTWDGGREKAPAAICRKVLEAKNSRTHEIEIWGDGHQTRSFMYIDDCTKGVEAIFESEIHEPINLGSDELVTINQLADIVEEIAGIKLGRNYNLNAPKGVNGRNSDNTKIKQQYLGWEPSIRLKDGLSKTYTWIEREMLAMVGR